MTNLPPARIAAAGLSWDRIDWEEPGFADLTWEWDDMHTPRALRRLSQSYVELLNAGMNVRARSLGLPLRTVLKVVNGYVYFAMSVDVEADERAAVLERAKASRKADIALVADWWRDSAKPEIVAMYREVDALPPAGAGPAELASAWDRVWQIADRIWTIHFRVILGAYEALDELVDAVKACVEGVADGDILGLASGSIEELAEVETGLSSLASMVAADPTLVERLRLAPPATIAELRALPGAADLADALDAFLAIHGHLGHLTEDLVEPSWAEAPSRLLADLAIRTGRDDGSVAARRAVREAAAATLEARIRSDLAGRPEDLVTFERALAAARSVGWLTEGHNYWLDRMCGDRLRRFTGRIAPHLVGSGVITAAEDVWHLARDEVGPLLRTPADRRALVAERRAEHDLRCELTPPRTLGKPPEAADPATVDRFDGPRFASTDTAVLRGSGASAGVVRAVARVVAGPADFDRVRPGDIVVARASNPGWVPLFGIAGGFVTDTGGVLSHAAVVAREYGVPAVVGTGDATGRIADGQIVEIDGSTGIVRLG
ncbi:MAG: PEP-utilizing enzyme [Candidatus Limnocylindrales bacterium]